MTNKKYIKYLREQGYKPTSICMLYLSYPLIGFKTKEEAKRAYDSFFGQSHLLLPICVDEAEFNQTINELLTLIKPFPEVRRFLDGKMPESMRK